MKIGIKKTVEVEAKVLKLYLKVRDACSFGIEDQDGQEIVDYDGYVPGFFPGDHYGDYVIFDIDIDTGEILNWKAPTQADIDRLTEEGA